MKRHVRETTLILSKLDNAINTRYRTAALRCAVLFLAIGLGYSYTQNPGLFDGISWKPVLVVVFILVPITAILNTLEFQATGHLVGVTIGMRKCLEINIIGSAANMLPLPGGTVVRIAGLGAAGVRAGEATSATFLVVMIWVGAGFSLSGLGALMSGNRALGMTFLVVGFVGWVLVLVLGRPMKGGYSAILKLTVIKSVLIAVDVLRIYFCFSAISVFASFFQSAGLSVSAIFGSAVSVVPAGLGVRETVSAMLAPALGVLATQAFVVATLNRLLGLIVTLPLALILMGLQTGISTGVAR